MIEESTFKDSEVKKRKRLVCFRSWKEAKELEVVSSSTRELGEVIVVDHAGTQDQRKNFALDVQRVAMAANKGMK